MTGLVVLSRTFSPNIKDEVAKKKWGIRETNQTGKYGPEHLILASKDSGHIQAGDCSKDNGVNPNPQLHHHVPLHDCELKLESSVKLELLYNSALDVAPHSARKALAVLAQWP